MESGNLTLESVFLIIRLVTFMITLLLIPICIGFGAWSITSSNALTYSYGPAVIICNVLLIFSAIVGALVAMFYPRLPFAKVKYECSWATILSLINIAGMSISTIFAPKSLVGNNSVFFKSSFLFLTVGWSTTIILALYALALVIAIIIHYKIFPNLMICPMHKVPWFIKADIEGQSFRVSMFFLPDHDSRFACRSPSWEGNFAGIKMAAGPFAVHTAKEKAQEEAARRMEEAAKTSNVHRPSYV